MAEKRMPKNEIIDILRAILAYKYNLAKYQYFSLRPGLFDKYHLDSRFIRKCELRFDLLLRL